MAYLDYIDTVVALLLAVASYVSATIMMFASIERTWAADIAFAYDEPKKLADEVERQFRKKMSRESSRESPKRVDVATYDARVIRIRSAVSAIFDNREPWLIPGNGYEVGYVVIHDSDEGKGIFVNEIELGSSFQGDSNLKRIAAAITDALLRTTWIKIPARQWSLQDR